AAAHPPDRTDCRQRRLPSGLPVSARFPHGSGRPRAREHLRNRAGNFLLVLTANFDRLDFVLVEKHTPVDEEGSIAKPQVKLRPITFSVDRHKPERIQLRVLGRFTWTEVDAFAQYEKLVAA